MSLKPIDLTGGKSVYCFNQHQMDQARRLFTEDSDSGKKIRDMVATLEKEFTRNEQATLAFTLIEHLNETSEF
ncbi:hypothetical protein P3T73_04740 [Kiritimatiellota bacterium B12222]|nr:hypothetical protein P3T73_04740 [Kiritimatiellota bacterium B12222]